MLQIQLNVSSIFVKLKRVGGQPGRLANSGDCDDIWGRIIFLSFLFLTPPPILHSRPYYKRFNFHISLKVLRAQCQRYAKFLVVCRWFIFSDCCFKSDVNYFLSNFASKKIISRILYRRDDVIASNDATVPNECENIFLV